jgi:hypothetical protein
MALCNTMLLAAINPASPPQSVRMVGIFTVMLCGGYVVIWFYWQGRNWARIGALLYSGSSIFHLFSWNQLASLYPVVGMLSTPIHVRMAASAVLGAALLYYLNTRPVVEFFSAVPSFGAGRIVYGLWLMGTAVSDYPFFHPVATSIVVVGGLCVFVWGRGAARSSTPRTTPRAPA